MLVLCLKCSIDDTKNVMTVFALVYTCIGTLLKHFNMR
uniref:Uncharacterized protein n=1 Tax=Anguilla anguilla TaxID=7936 RepID=A0A0E9Q5B1_ANGAN